MYFLKVFKQVWMFLCLWLCLLLNIEHQSHKLHTSQTILLAYNYCQWNFLSERTYIMTEDSQDLRKMSSATSFKVSKIHYGCLHYSAVQFEHNNGFGFLENNYFMKSNGKIMPLHSQNLLEYAFIKIFRFGFRS